MGLMGRRRIEADTIKQTAANRMVDRVALGCGAKPAPRKGATAVSANHESRPDDDRLLANGDLDLASARDFLLGDRAGGSQQPSSGSRGVPQQCLLEVWMGNAPFDMTAWCVVRPVIRIEWQPVVVALPDRQRPPTRFLQPRRQPEPVRLRRTPGVQPFAPNAISKASLPLNDDDADAASCQGCAEARSGNPTTDDRDIRFQD